MKQKIYIAALLAGMLALAGCGGGSSTDQTNSTEQTPLEIAQERIKELEGNDNRSETEKLAENTEICEAGGGIYANGSCTPNTSASDAKAADAIAEALKGYNLRSHADAANALPDYDAAKKMGSMKKGSISVEGEAFKDEFENAASGITLAFSAGKLGITSSNTNEHTAESDSFGTGQLVTLKSNKPNTDGDEIWEGKGSYRGVSGTFSCETDGTNACEVRKLANGVAFRGTGATWTFTPDNPTAKVTVDDLVTFGFWSDNDPGDSDYALGLFTTRALLDATSGAAKSPHGYTGTGTATFKGTAVGHFSVGEGGDATQGDFEAPAELTATFTTVGTPEGTLKGTITADTWSVELMEARLASGYNVNAGSGSLKQANGTASNVDATDGAPTQTVWTLNSDKGDPGGSWQAALYHSIGSNDNDVTVANDFPDYTAGEFTAEHGLTGFMIGAFAAELDE